MKDSMKNSLVMLCFVLIGFVAFSQKSATLVIKTVIFCDHCKECESCAGLMETELSYVKGVKSIEFNDKDTTIIVKYSPKKTNPEAIRKAISQIGFAADNIPADPAAYEKLDTCCKRRE